MNRWNQRQSITFRSVCTAILTGSAVLGTWGISAAPAWADDVEPVVEPVDAVRMDRQEVPDLLKDLYQKLGGNPNTLNPQPKAAMLEITEFWQARGLPEFANRLSILFTATQLQTMLLTEPGDLDPVSVTNFLGTLSEIIDATKQF